MKKFWKFFWFIVSLQVFGVSIEILVDDAMGLLINVCAFLLWIRLLIAFKAQKKSGLKDEQVNTPIY